MESKFSIFQRTLALLCAIAMFVAMVPGGMANPLVLDVNAETPQPIGQNNNLSLGNTPAPSATPAPVVYEITTDEETVELDGASKSVTASVTDAPTTASVSYQWTADPADTDLFTMQGADTNQVTLTPVEGKYGRAKIQVVATVTDGSTEPSATDPKEIGVVVYGTPNIELSVDAAAGQKPGDVLAASVKLEGADITQQCTFSWKKDTVEVAATASYTPQSEGTYTVTATLPADGLRGEATADSGVIAVAKVTPTVTVNVPGMIEYMAASSATFESDTAGGITVGGNTYPIAAGGSVQVLLDTTAVGEKSLSYSFAPTNSVGYNTCAGEKTYTVGKKQGEVTVELPAGDIALGAQAEATFTVNTPGELTINGSVQALLEGNLSYVQKLDTSTAGEKTLKYSFKPDDSGYAEVAESTQKYTVNKGDVTVEETLPTDRIVYGAQEVVALKATVDGTFVVGKDTPGEKTYNTSEGEAEIPLDTSSAGEKQLVVDFEPLDADNYAAKNIECSYTVQRKELKFTVAVADKNFDNTTAITTDNGEIMIELDESTPLVVGDEGASLVIDLANGPQIEFDSVGSVSEDTTVGVKVQDGLQEFAVQLTKGDGANYIAKVDGGIAFEKAIIMANTLADGSYTLPDQSYTDANEKIWYKGDAQSNTLVVKGVDDYKVGAVDTAADGFSTEINIAPQDDLVFWVQNANGDIAQATIRKVGTDNKYPVVQLTGLDGMGPDFSNTSIQYTFTITDEDSGLNVESLAYYIAENSNAQPTFEDSEWKVAPTPIEKDGAYVFTVEVPATGYLYVRAADNVENRWVSTANRALVIEDTSPTVEIAVDNQNSQQNHTMTVTATDPESGRGRSGIDKVEYRLLNSENEVSTEFDVRVYNIDRNGAPGSLQDIENWCGFPNEDKDGKADANIITLENLSGTYYLEVTVTDFCGNTTIKKSAPIVMDNAAPEVKVDMAGGQEVSGNYYYKADTCGITVTFTDTNLDDRTASSAYTASVANEQGNSQQKTLKAGENSISFTPEEIVTLGDGTLVLTVNARDAAGNTTQSFTNLTGMKPEQASAQDQQELAALQASFVLDTTPSKIVAVMSGGQTGDDSVYYYKADNCGITVTFADTNLTVNGGMTQYEASIANAENAKNAISGVMDAGKMEFTPEDVLSLGDGNIILTVAATDVAGNVTEKLQTVTGMNYDGDQAPLKADFQLDAVAPTIVAKMGKTTPYNNVYYYKADDCGITVTFEDANLAISGGLTKYEASIANAEDSANAIRGVMNAGKMEFSPEDVTSLKDGVVVLTVAGVDAAGNQTVEFTELVGMKDETGQSDAGGAVATVKSSFILDTTAPVLKNVTVKKVDDSDGEHYDDLDEVYFNSSFVVTYTVTERYYDVIKKDESYVAATAKTAQTDTNAAVVVNTDAVGADATDYTYNITVTVDPNGKQIAREDYVAGLRIVDAAGNLLVAATDAAFAAPADIKVENGSVTNQTTCVLDTVAPKLLLDYRLGDSYDNQPLAQSHYYDEGAYYNQTFTAFYTFTDVGGMDGNKMYATKKTNTDVQTDKLTSVNNKTNEYKTSYTVQRNDANADYYFGAYGLDMAGNALCVTETQINRAQEQKTTEGHSNEQTAFIGKAKILDTVDPEVDISFTDLEDTHYYLEAEEKAEEIWTAYYNTDVTATFDFRDGNGLDDQKIFWSRSKDGAENQKSIAFGTNVARTNIAPSFAQQVQAANNNDGDYRYTVYGEDKAGNPLKVTENQTRKSSDAPVYTDRDEPKVRHNAQNPYTTAIKAVDTVAPRVFVNYTALDDSHYYDDDGGTAYYNRSFETGFDFSDSYGVDQAKMLVARLFNGKTETAYAAIGTDYAATAVNATYYVQTSNAEGIYKYQVYGEDKAGNALIVTENNINKAGAAVKEDAGHNAAAAYTGHAKVLDITSPMVELTFGTGATNKSLRRGDGNDRYYFNQAFTATFTLAETNFDASKIAATYGITNGENYLTDTVDARSLSMVGQTPSSNSGINYTYTADYSADGVYAFALDGFDRAGNPVALKNELAKNVTIQSYNTQNQQGTGNTFGRATSYVVAKDTIAPTLDVSISDAGITFYTAKMQPVDGATHYTVSTNNPYQKRTTATATFTGTDCSPLSMVYAIPSTVSGQSAALDNGDNYTYANVQSSSFNAQQTIFIETLKVIDLAGNVSVMPGVSNKIYLDTTAPINDQLAPTISLTATANGQGRGPGGNPLFASSVTVNAKLTDPNEGVSSAGLYQVFYRVTVNGDDWTGRVAASSTAGGYVASAGTIQYKASGSSYSPDASTVDEPLTYNDSIDFTFDAQTFNYNDVKIYVWAVDNAGNAIDQSNSAFYYFGIDITSPTMEVSYDNNDAQNEKYFKADRTATVVVTERNFDPNNTQISTESQAAIGSWSYAAGAMPNGDDDTWTCQVTYSVDGDYTFDVKTADLLGHDGGTADYGGSVAPREFVLDKTNPVIEISFDNNDVLNSKYYKETRTANIEITEHNFSAEGVEVATTASIAEGSVSAPSAGGWSSAGDSNRASVNFSDDGDYTMTVDYVDLAGNQAETETVDEFTVDTTAPELEISGVENEVAYNGDVAPIITYHDVNFDNTSAGVSIVGYRHPQGENLSGTRAEDAFGGSFICDNIEPLKENDDIYTATGSVMDLAGNTTETTIVFSVNRFGSTYMLGSDTEALLEQYYTNKTQNITVTEINVSPIATRRVTVALNGDVTNLAEGSDYSVQTSIPGWYQYDYIVNAANFEREGLYDVTLYSEDEAGNASSNRAMKENNAATSELPIIFVVDTTAPLVSVTGVDNNEQYVDTERTIMVNYSDNITVTSLTLYLNGVAVQSYDQQQLAEANGTLQYLAKAENDWQTFSVEAVDVAGNIIQTEGVRYLLTDNLFVQYFNNKPLFYGSISGAVGVGALVWFLLAAKRRKKEEQQPAAAK